jgi:hypothetical protein
LELGFGLKPIAQLVTRTAIPRAIYFVCTLTDLVSCGLLVFYDLFLSGPFSLHHSGLLLVHVFPASALHGDTKGFPIKGDRPPDLPSDCRQEFLIFKVTANLRD